MSSVIHTPVIQKKHKPAYEEYGLPLPLCGNNNGHSGSGLGGSGMSPLSLTAHNNRRSYSPSMSTATTPGMIHLLLSFICHVCNM